MVRTIPAVLLRQAGVDITVEPYAGAGGHGPAYSAPVTVRCLLEEGRHLVRDTEGNEVTSKTTVRVRLADAAHFVTGSRVTLPNGTTPTVITTTRFDGGRLPVPSHLEVRLT